MSAVVTPGTVQVHHPLLRGVVKNVIPAKAGIHKLLKILDPRFRGDDKKSIFQHSRDVGTGFPLLAGRSSLIIGGLALFTSASLFNCISHTNRLVG